MAKQASKPGAVDLSRLRAKNTSMETRGRVQNGVVVLEDGVVLPEGAPVTVSCDSVRIWRRPGEKKPVEFPLVHSEQPGTLDLTNERIAEIFEEEDLAGFVRSFRQSPS